MAQSGLRSLSRNRSWSRSESAVLARVGIGVGVVKILLTPPAAPGVASHHPSIYDHLGRTVTHLPENIERQEEKESDSVDFKLKCYLAVEHRLINCVGENFRVTAIVV